MTRSQPDPEQLHQLGRDTSVPMDKMIEKAEKLLKRGRVEQTDIDRYNVIGDHGTYTVVRALDGKVVCSCPGFRGKGKCSHATAVIIMTTKFPVSRSR